MKWEFFMTENDRSENPYRAPAFDGDRRPPLDDRRPPQKLHQVHWRLPWYGYGYVPLVFAVLFVTDDRYSAFIYSGLLTLILLPLYSAGIVWLTVKRIQQGTNSALLTVYQILSIVPPLLWLLLVMTFNGSPA